MVSFMCMYSLCYFYLVKGVVSPRSKARLGEKEWKVRPLGGLERKKILTKVDSNDKEYKKKEQKLRCARKLCHIGDGSSKNRGSTLWATQCRSA